ncbi:MAG: type II secretion system minor pseudopilin GspJ [Kangiellaceae bacterium]|nr:type II secretion system minor pseudopilin GspJ [Kangiellaceae bacterium]
MISQQHKINHTFQRGFTLLEILVAMAIASLIGVGAMVLLDRATVAHQNIQQKGDRYNAIERTMLFISNDIQQIAPRKFRDEFGDIKENLTSDDSIGKTHLSFTRLGRRNPARLARSNLEKLTYLVEDEKLKRISYLYPDGMSVEQGLNRTLLDKIDKLSLQFFDGEDWSDFWPVDTAASSKKNTLPVAIRVTLELQDIGPINRLYVISDRKEKTNEKS